MKKLILVFAFLYLPKFTIAQELVDTTGFGKINQKAADFTLKNVDSANYYAQKALKMAESSNIKELKAEAFFTLSKVKLYESKLDEALEFNQESFSINLVLKNNKKLSLNYLRFGDIYNFKGDFVNATKYYLKCLESAELNKNYLLQQKVYRKLSIINISQNKFKEALNNGQKAAEIAKKTIPDATNEAENFFNLGTCYKYLKQNDLAETNFKKAYQFFEKTNYLFKMADVLCEMAAIYNDTDLIKSIEISLKAQKIFDSFNPENITSVNNMGNLGEKLFILAKNDSLIQKINNKAIPKNKGKILEKAEGYLQLAIEFSKKQNITQAILFYSGLMSEIQAYNGDYKNAYENLKFKFKYNDSLFSQENKNAIAKLESEKEVLKLGAESKQKTTNNKILIGLFSGLSLLSLLGYRNFKNRQKIQNLKITELEKDNQLLAIDAMLKGQEEERNRIAKDLHDGLGGMLSGVKMSFNNMKENLIMSAENVSSFEASIGQLDNTIGELRKIAHNMMPEALVKFGLSDAINDFCVSTAQSTHLKITYEHLGESRKLDNTANTYIYRIIQELINNAVKHAQPTAILVQMSTTPTKVLITVEDNGIGLNTNVLTSSKGVGIANIKHRVNYLKGSLSYENNMPNGTVVNIELVV